MSAEEKWVLLVFALTAVLWVFRKDLEVGLFTVPGWSRLLPYPKLIDDGTVALGMALTLFFIPSQSKDAKWPTLQSIDVFRQMPWDIVILFGGGFALAKGFEASGLSALIGNKFAGLAGMSEYYLISIVSGALTFLTELTSNTATTQMVLPILASIATQVKMNPLLLMIPATLSASCAFMLPVATPPNAIVFGSGRIRIIDMAKTGILINILGIFIVATLFYTLGLAVFSIDPGVFPEWAAQIAAAAK